MGAAPPDDIADARKTQCLHWMVNAYPTGLDEAFCSAEYGLPSPFFFKCLAAQKQGYASVTQRTACRLALEKAARATDQGYVVR